MSPLESKNIIIFITTGKLKEAKTIATSLVEQKLAACVGILPQNSVYRWKGKIVEDNEYLLLIKTQQDQFNNIRQVVLSLHSYEVPEIISIVITEGHKPYLDWIRESLST